jgi:hypothetical protein
MGRAGLSGRIAAALPLLIAMLAASSSALAQSSPMRLCEVGNYVGSVLGSPGVMSLIGVVCYISGAVLAMMGVTNLAKHSENPNQVELTKPAVMLLVSALMFALPSFAQTMGESMFGSGVDFGTRADDSSGMQGKAGGQGVCPDPGALAASGASGSSNLGKLAAAIGYNSPGLALMAKVWAGLTGLLLLAAAAKKLMLVEQKKLEFGNAMWTGVAGALLLTFASQGDGELFASLAGTVGATEQVNFLAQGVVGVGSNASSVQCATMTGVMMFIRFVGLLAILRGIMKLKAYGEGKEGALFSAMTHMGGGALAANIVWTAKMLNMSGILTNTALIVMCVS